MNPPDASPSPVQALWMIMLRRRDLYDEAKTMRSAINEVRTHWCSYATGVRICRDLAMGGKRMDECATWVVRDIVLYESKARHPRPLSFELKPT